MPYQKLLISLLGQILGQALRQILGLRRRFLFSLLIGFWVALVISTVTQVSEAQTSIIHGTIAEVLDSNEVFIQNRQARVNDVVNQGQQVRTGRARAQVNFNTGAVARLSNNSVLTVGQCAQLRRGVLLVNGAMNGCTASVTAGVRGTAYILEVYDDGREEIKVLEGEVMVTKNESGSIEPEPAEPTDSPQSRADQPSIPRAMRVGIPSTRPSASPSPEPSPQPVVESDALGNGTSPSPESSPEPSPQPVVESDALGNSTSPSPEPSPQPVVESDAPANTITLYAGQKVTTRRGLLLGLVENIPIEEISAILAGDLFNGYLQSLPGYAEIQRTLQQIYPELSLPSVPEQPVQTPSLRPF